MKKSVKYLLFSCALITSSITMSVNVKAGIRGRISSLFSRLTLSRTQGYNPIKDKIKYKVPSNLLEQASNLLRNDRIVGVDAKDFDDRVVGKIHSENWYMQRVTSTGDRETLVSTIEPKIFSVNEDGIVHHKYLNNDNGMVTSVYHEGLPNWLPGKEIKKEVKNRPVLLKTRNR